MDFNFRIKLDCLHLRFLDCSSFLWFTIVFLKSILGLSFLGYINIYVCHDTIDSVLSVNQNYYLFSIYISLFYNLSVILTIFCITNNIIHYKFQNDLLLLKFIIVVVNFYFNYVLIKLFYYLSYLINYCSNYTC